MELLEPVTRSSPNVTIANIRQILKKKQRGKTCHSPWFIHNKSTGFQWANASFNFAQIAECHTVDLAKISFRLASAEKTDASQCGSNKNDVTNTSKSEKRKAPRPTGRAWTGFLLPDCIPHIGPEVEIQGRMSKSGGTTAIHKHHYIMLR